jgi:hypothetical protein
LNHRDDAMKQAVANGTNATSMKMTGGAALRLRTEESSSVSSSSTGKGVK